MKNIVLISQLAISIITPILVGVLFGMLIDKWLNLNGIFSIILMLLGVASGFLSAYKIIMRTNKDLDKKEHSDER